MSQPAPHISKELVEWLERLFPSRCPREIESSRRIWMNAGANEVVRKLRNVYDEQTPRAAADLTTQ
jgi:hypothetical protein